MLAEARIPLERSLRPHSVRPRKKTDREASGGPARPAALVGLASTHACRLNRPSRDRTCFDKRCRPCRPCRPAGGFLVVSLWVGLVLCMIRRVFAVVLATAFAAAVPACAQTIFVQDSFTVAANTMLEAHTPNIGGAWTRQTGSSGITINAAADNARNVAAGDWSIYSNGTIAPTAEITMGVTVTFTNANANNFVDLFGRTSVSLLNAYSARLSASGAVTLTRWSGGTATTIATGTVTIALNTQIQFILSLKNASKEVAINGTTVA